ncbi:GyrI-like domain-containing protein [Deinococcus alpinitundrae]|uniref:GyrI-like domain-containing protein n=1 Tax=Deinococcus alpinitundrae TaxID=468913 RepID=UPI001379E8B5|nr:GyrI-like domain-containing protein [Deinococcus alpinitundrae]
MPKGSLNHPEVAPAEQATPERQYIGKPSIQYRSEQHSVGIRTITPFKGMFAVVDQLLKELRSWIKVQAATPTGPFFLRLHVIDMDGPMDIEVGCLVPEPHPGDERVRPGTFPAGRYASLRYSRYALRANRALLDWGKQEGLTWDRWDAPEGDRFGCRYEAYLTDYRLEPRKSVWEVELAIKLSDDLPQDSPTASAESID